MAKYLVEAKRVDGTPLYESTQTGNFDMYLPFIERGIELLNQQGKMGYIAPNLWLISKYGEGLRRKCHRQGCLDRWIDFKGFQVFREAITYTALQFFSGSNNQHFSCFYSPDGDISSINWDKINEVVQYDEISPGLVWNLYPRNEQKFLLSLDNRYIRLGDNPDLVVGFRGVETGADSHYHFKRISPGKYCYAKGNRGEVIIELEDEIMKPLVSGPEATRYIYPLTHIYVLFPYTIENDKGRALTAWAKSQRESKLSARLESINPMLRPGVRLSVANEFGELKLLAVGMPIINGLFPSDDEVDFIAAQWRQKIRRTNVTEKFDARRLVNLLLKLRKTDNHAIQQQVIQIDAEIQNLDDEITLAEESMNRLTYLLYKLTDKEIRLVENG